MSKKYIIWNHTDSMQGWPGTFKTIVSAEKKIRAIKNEFVHQGYYFTHKMERIPLEEVVFEIVLI